VFFYIFLPTVSSKHKLKSAPSAKSARDYFTLADLADGADVCVLYDTE